MKVNVPRNINDEDLMSKPSNFSLPLSEPTTVSYLIQRIRLAELCRVVVDSIPIAICDPAEIDYDVVISLDEKFEKFDRELPFFFQYDDHKNQKRKDLHHRYPHISMQWYVVGFTSHTRRLRLHQPFIVRAPVNPRYNYSRKIALVSARKVINLYRMLVEDNLAMALAGPKVVFVLHHLFWAITILVMDLCYNKTEGNEADRRAEVKEACNMLESDQNRSLMVNEFLQSLMDILRRHGVGLETLESDIQVAKQHENGFAARAIQPSGELNVSNKIDSLEGDRRYKNGPSILQQQPIESDFDKLWSTFIEHGSNLDALDWDELFSDLDPMGA
jgi:hypothetical protein